MFLNGQLEGTCCSYGGLEKENNMCKEGAEYKEGKQFGKITYHNYIYQTPGRPDVREEELWNMVSDVDGNYQKNKKNNIT